MSAAKHTPGPWTIVNVYDYVQVRSHSKGIADLFDERDEGEEEVEWGQGETDANARLIAAAPDLLAALKVARGTIETLVHGIKCRDAAAKTNVYWDPDFTSAIDAAIAKATEADTA